MKTLLLAVTVFGLGVGAAAAQNNSNSMNNPKAPGTTGALQTPTAPGVATDPEQVKAQEGNMAKNSPGTVGAAPGAATPSQMPGKK